MAERAFTLGLALAYYHQTAHVDGTAHIAVDMAPLMSVLLSALAALHVM